MSFLHLLYNDCDDSDKTVDQELWSNSVGDAECVKVLDVETDVEFGNDGITN